MQEACKGRMQGKKKKCGKQRVDPACGMTHTFDVLQECGTDVVVQGVDQGKAKGGCIVRQFDRCECEFHR